MLRRILALLITAGLGAAALNADQVPPGTPRELVPLDGGWRFHAGDEPRAAEPGFDDHAWQPVDLPHTWNGLDGEDGGNNYRRGAGWYRRHVFVGDSLKGRRLYLQFDGASLMADVYVNGAHLGNHMGGFARFRFDATDVLKAGADNVLAVRVDNSDLGIPPTSSDFTIFGGLYRGVSLLATDDVQVSPMDMASPGVFVEARPKGNDALLLIRAELANRADAPRDVDVRVLVLDADRKVVAGGKGAFHTRLDPGGVHEVLKPLTLAHPRLWQGMEDPYLYTVRVELRPVFPDNKTGDLVDAVEDHFGVRFFSVDAENGFILNGRPVSLHGYNRHQDWPDKGWAISDANEAEDFSILLDSGANAVRTSHYQDSQSWYDRCDRAGV
ncbi:MAG TPA: glycoside hydrolase family 2 TIM barrel-domain containing protein, partial [Candidatus Methylacidiphilales bacterium]|nr:glycoside hydrolase family 2 TIM barrel-domain containing protein [Candidatus Methylacidiphilales bacterium]